MNELTWESLRSSKDSTFSIGQLSKEFGVTARAIRFYEDKGLISPSRQGQTRIYSRRERIRLHIILRAKRLGFALGDIGELLDLYEADGGLIEQGRLVLLRIHQRIEELERQRDDIESTVSEMKQISRNLSQQMADRAAQRDEREENALIGYGVVPSTT